MIIATVYDYQVAQAPKAIAMAAAMAPRGYSWTVKNSWEIKGVEFCGWRTPPKSRTSTCLKP